MPGTKPKINSFSKFNFTAICDKLAKKDKELALIIRRFGYPPMWQREPGFQTLIHIILEQQVSLASAKAALDRLIERIGHISPEKLVELTDEDMRSCYFSRQKTVYARYLAQSILDKHLDLEALNSEPDEMIRTELKKIKGIGDWTVDVYLLMALQRADIFPVGDLAMVNSMKTVKTLAPGTGKEELLLMAEDWRPYRSVAAMILWHNYLESRKKISG
jgi:DNA-3-methyladenine glycosylase II